MRRGLTRSAVARRLAGGRGSGHGALYKAFLGVRDVPSRGLTTLVPGRLTGRQHIVFSTLERHCLLFLQRLDDVIDIREQFPLPLDRSTRIAEKLGLKHPRYSRGSEMVMTVDFLVTRRRGDGQRWFHAISVKPSKELAIIRTREKLEIERLGCISLGWRWALVTEKELPPTLCGNLDWLDQWHNIPEAELRGRDVNAIAACILEAICQEPGNALNEVCASVDRLVGLDAGTGLTVFAHMLARKRWTTDLLSPLDVNRPAPILTVG
ncbi:hypothetical protein E2C06_23200 [Dankookia rubra]|uniref:TnsA endonuclease N-terminal domain-containing protein n=1 Tax=Dankookia rubra TaxID=1442381 RepID=A0A4R5QC94_9PROT|nr:TnsA endonuclease N-terminal domain-containing protein [Dankookia rubra]TDH60238.1 hypothetical protein E2C06_23200 [Dankookia rubra]